MKKLYKWLYDENEISYKDFEKRFIVLGVIVVISLVLTLLIKL